MKALSRVLFAAALLLALPASAAEWKVDAADTRLNYRLKHPFHEVVGVSAEAAGGANYDPATGGSVRIEAPVKSFRSGNANRDVHMLEVVAAHRNPTVLFEAKLPAGLPESGTATVEGTVTLKGVSRPIKAEVTLAREGDKLKVKASFPVSLEGHQIERPSLMLIKVEDALRIEAEVVLQPVG
jgi:polyisoprenoid-binding protein YceI